ncbi:hypothetical protein CEXT_161821 [Caerostris extrusa]|uniref:Uncharacterized protein n=1 Tax=Caerostris extrusa TaxID=172846 RepID=A0AAV4VWP2_CAEEX|nr:hypothetical protein CEXT_161821 [Caerostris extrusa]
MRSCWENELSSFKYPINIIFCRVYFRASARGMKNKARAVVREIERANKLRFGQMPGFHELGFSTKIHIRKANKDTLARKNQ